MVPPKRHMRRIMSYWVRNRGFLVRELPVSDRKKPVDNVSEIGLVADVDESNQGKELVHLAIAVIDVKVLESLQN